MSAENELFFCETHNAGPWGIREVGTNGKSIYNFHIEKGCNVVPYKEKNHRDLSDSINDFVDDLKDFQVKQKDERELRFEKFGLPITQIENYLNTQVKDDPRLVKQLLRVYFSAYTKNPRNMAILAPSSDGKTHATVQVSKIFPEKDFISVGRLSPTALIHQYGMMIDENGNNIEPKLKELEKLKNTSQNDEEINYAKETIQEMLKTAKNLVDLTNKVLLFLDNPSPQTYEVLKPILSHDKEEILYKTTKGDGSLKVKETIIRGWPATIVCSAKNEAKNEVWPEIETRFFMSSPNNTVTKYKKANQLTSQKMGLPSWSSDIYDNSDDRKWCSLYINEIITQLKCHKDFWHPLYDIIDQFFPSNQGVMMRHYKRLLSFCNVESMINAEQRPTIEFKNTKNEIIKTFVGTLEDIESAIDVIGNLSVIPPEKLKFYDDIFVPLFNETNTVQNDLTEQQKRIVGKTGVTSEELAEKYTKVFLKPITAKQIRENYLHMLRDEGLIQIEQDEDNKRQLLYYPTNSIAIHNLGDLKSSIISNSPFTKLKYDYVIPRLKMFNQLTCKFRKTPHFFFFNKQILTLDMFISEITRQLKRGF